MLKNKLLIDKIPAVVWGADSDKVVIAVHGRMSNKEDVPIEMFASHAIDKGYQVLSFDLLQHGDRKDEATLCKTKECIESLTSILQYAKNKWTNISLFANSMGAFYSMLAYQDEHLKQAWFLSPLVDMRRLIGNMMRWFTITEDQLEREKIVSTPVGQNLYQDDYIYVKEHPISSWNVPTYILYGTKDDTCEFDTITKFVDKFSAKLQIAQDAEHYFHTPEQLEQLDRWLDEVVD